MEEEEESPEVSLWSVCSTIALLPENLSSATFSAWSTPPGAWRRPWRPGWQRRVPLLRYEATSPGSTPGSVNHSRQHMVAEASRRRTGGVVPWPGGGALQVEAGGGAVGRDEAELCEGDGPEALVVDVLDELPGDGRGCGRRGRPSLPPLSAGSRALAPG